MYFEVAALVQVIGGELLGILGLLIAIPVIRLETGPRGTTFVISLPL